MFTIEVKHRGADTAEFITVAGIYAARKLYKAVLLAAIDAGPANDIERVALINPLGETIAACGM